MDSALIYIDLGKTAGRQGRELALPNGVHLLTDHSPTAVFGVSSSIPHAMLGSRALEALAFYCLRLRRLP